MRRLLGVATLLLACSVPLPAFAKATILIFNADGPGEGFNDPTPALPVGGNPGTTLGQQRLNAFQAAADIWGDLLHSDVPIVIQSNFDPLTCTASTATLGSAGATSVFSDFPGAPQAGTWYPVALANAITGEDLDPGFPQIAAQFNSNLNGNVGCLGGATWYLGLDGNHGEQPDLETVLLHEFAHGLGFATFISKSGPTLGQELAGQRDVYESFMRSTVSNLFFPQMSNAQRASAMADGRHVIWDGPFVTGAAPAQLAPGAPSLTLSGGLTGDRPIGTAAFGPPLPTIALVKQIVLAQDSAPFPNDGCTALVNGAAVSGKIALIDRGSCEFSVKVANAQAAGAVGVIIADNAAGSPPAELGGSNPAILIPAVRITQVDGNALKTALGLGTVNAKLQADPARLIGADSSNHALLYTPSPIAAGSNLSHWDTLSTPNLLMEPAINDDLGHDVDLTLALLHEIGWQDCYENDDCDDGDACNGAESCASGVCAAGTPPNCDDGSVCTSDGCDADLGCLYTPVADGTTCADGNVCNGAESCSSGACGAGTPLACDDGNLCTSEACGPVSGCVYTPVSAGVACGGGGTCNGAGLCTGAVCKSVKLTNLTPGILPSGSAALLAASNVSCGSGQTPEYRFLYHQDGGPAGYAEFRGWSTSPNAEFSNQGRLPGKYTLRVYARHVGSIKAYSSLASITLQSGNTCSKVTLTTLDPSPKPPGTLVDLNAVATCTEGPAEYEFAYAAKGSTTYLPLRGWGPGTLAWDSTGVLLGDYMLRVRARAIGNLSAYEVYKTLAYTMADNCNKATAVASPKSPQPAGTPITLSGTGTCAALSVADLRYSYRADASPTWIVLADWGNAPSVPWATVGLTPGLYKLRVEARAPGYAGAAQGTKILNYTLTP